MLLYSLRPEKDAYEIVRNAHVVSSSSWCHKCSQSCKPASQMLIDSHDLLISDTTKHCEKRYVQHDKHDSRPDCCSSKREMVSGFPA